MNTRRRRYPRRTDLFLVRVWTESAPSVVDATNPATASPGSAAPGEEAWCGSMQRVVDGESYPFQGWPNLVDTLRAMLLATRDPLDR